jgi:hypothetical protein
MVTDIDRSFSYAGSCKESTAVAELTDALLSAVRSLIPFKYHAPLA